MLVQFHIYTICLNYRIFQSIMRTSNFFDIPFDVQITRMTLTSGRVRKYRPLLAEDTGVIPKNMPGQVAVIFCIDNARVIYTKNHCY
jgi:hypothetical protein